MIFSQKDKYLNNSELDKYIKSHIPALYLLEPESFRNEEDLIDYLVKYFAEQYHFKELYTSVPPEFREHLLLNYKTIKQLLSEIEPQYIDNAIDELWEGLQEETIYGKYNKNGIINF